MEISIGKSDSSGFSFKRKILIENRTVQNFLSKKQETRCFLPISRTNTLCLILKILFVKIRRNKQTNISEQKRGTMVPLSLYKKSLFQGESPPIPPAPLSPEGGKGGEVGALTRPATCLGGYAPEPP